MPCCPFVAVAVVVAFALGGLRLRGMDEGGGVELRSSVGLVALALLTTKRQMGRKE